MGSYRGKVKGDYFDLSVLREVMGKGEGCEEVAGEGGIEREGSQVEDRLWRKKGKEKEKKRIEGMEEEEGRKERRKKKVWKKKKGCKKEERRRY